jgi:hypothetical protein
MKRKKQILFIKIKKHISDIRYIKIRGKPVLGINFDNINEKYINSIRYISKENGLGEIFIILKNNNYNTTFDKNIIDGIYDSIQYNSLENVFFKDNKTINYFYTHLLYHYLFKMKFNNKNKIYKETIPLSKYPIYANNNISCIYSDYSPEKFYFLSKMIIDWTKENHKKDNQYIFIDDFHNLAQNSNTFGFSNINYFSKALYGLPIINNNFNLTNLKNHNLVLVQVHLYYIDLLPEVVNKTNNIPVPFDLFITTDTEEKKIMIEDMVKLISRANKYEVLITKNKGRDIIPCLIQIKDIIKKYKYFCHIHTKKHGENEYLGKYWRVYLYENLLGNNNTIGQILSDFENNNDLGFIFPEHFYVEIKHAYDWNYYNLKHINHIFKILFPKRKLKVGKFLNFPVGNMFWARTKAVYQVFNEKIIKLAPDEKGQIDRTILHAIERIWLYLTKINGYYYKTFLYYI